MTIVPSPKCCSTCLKIASIVSVAGRAGGALQVTSPPANLTALSGYVFSAGPPGPAGHAKTGATLVATETDERNSIAS
ncbi:hypothetical protein GCM10027026_12740 [Myroides odoratimimus subsp. xuanwuensis]